MKKQIFILLYGFVLVAQAELVSDNTANEVSNINLEILLEKAPVDAQKILLKNKGQLKVQLEQLYLRRAVARMAIQEGLDTEGMNAGRLEEIRNEALYAFKLEALRKSNKKDYSKYAKQLYLVNQSDYKEGERIDAAHILISTKEVSEEEALEKAQKIRQQLVQGESFSELALKESDDKSVQRNQGQLGLFDREKMVKPFSDAALALQIGEISQPVKTRYGYHIIKLNNKISGRIQSFDEVEESIIRKLKEKDWNTASAKFLEQIKKDNKMQINEQALDEFVIKKLDELNKTVIK